MRPRALTRQLAERQNRSNRLREFLVVGNAKELTGGLIMVDQCVVRFQRDYALLQAVQNDMQAVFGKDQVVDVAPYLFRKVVERQAQLSQLVLAVLVGTY
ncbi:hypothetical protein SDC9_89899 [bioreactor metagenome]|uniref:Uncharacterized protein n=1 Tax=bioreactor metagenome TaxID=1076179 RepID=A0A644ZR39_9ZZZZ